MTVKQKDAVYAALVLAQSQGLEGDAARNFAVEQVKIGLMSGEVQHTKGAFTDEARAMSYSRSLIANWLKKDERLNGNVPYVPAKPRGPQVKDEALKALNENLKSLKAHSADSDLIARVESAINAKKAELAAEKGKSKVQSIEETMASLEALGIQAG